MSAELYDMRVRLADIFGPLFDRLTDAEVGAAAVVMRRCDERNAEAADLLREWLAYGGNQDVRRASERWLAALDHCACDTHTGTERSPEGVRVCERCGKPQ